PYAVVAVNFQTPSGGTLNAITETFTGRKFFYCDVPMFRKKKATAIGEGKIRLENDTRERSIETLRVFG
ncbi:MAG: hypothetical protein ACREA2_17125, partial [Blastocatellia bacterium]